ncbi:Hypothetical protein HDN1F_24000 [gamma proteobacterium HdN1]|nr:Hypothetical protein HDN1F_24000 [gamma proteobacterium HdN1]
MLNLFLISVVLILIFVALMAIGVVMGREPIRGSCGGLNKLGLRDESCPVCGGSETKCESSKAVALAKDAAKK